MAECVQKSSPTPGPICIGQARTGVACKAMEVSFTAVVLRVFIASPGDLAEDRDIVEQAIHEWNRQHANREGLTLLPMRWEWAAARQGGDGQRQINEQQVRDSDIVLAMFHTKLGRSTLRAESGTAEEIELAEQYNKPVHVLVCTRPVSPGDLDPEEYDRLRAYVQKLRARGLTKDYADASGLRSEVTNSLWNGIEACRSSGLDPASTTIRPAPRTDAPRAPKHAADLGSLTERVAGWTNLTAAELDESIRSLNEFADVLATVTVEARQLLSVVAFYAAATEWGDLGVTRSEVARRMSVTPREIDDLVAELDRFRLAYIESDAASPYIILRSPPANIDWEIWEDLKQFVGPSERRLQEIVVDLRFDKLDRPKGAAEVQEGPAAEPTEPEVGRGRIHVAQALVEQESSDPFGSNGNRLGKWHAVAVPRATGRAQARSMTRAPQAAEFRRIIEVTERSLPSSIRDFFPAASVATEVRRSQRAVTLVTPERDVQTEAQSQSAERSFVSIQLREDGSLFMTASRLTDTDPDDQTWILDGLAIAYTVRLVRYARLIADVLGYDGDWDFGVLGTGLKGRASTAHRQNWTTPRPFDADRYEEILHVSREKLERSPREVVDGLVEGLLFVLGTADNFEEAIRDATS